MKKINSIWIYTLIVAGFVLSFTNNCNSQPTSYPIDSKVYTTHDRTVVPIPVPIDAAKIFPYEIFLIFFPLFFSDEQSYYVF